MTERIKKQGNAAYFILAAAVFSVIGFVVYLVNSSTGYMAGRSVNGIVIVCTLAAIVVLVSMILFADKIGSVPEDLLLVLSGFLAIAGLSLFVLDRVTIIADIYFLPVNYPASEAATMNGAFAGFSLYLLTILSVTVAAFMKRPNEAK